MRKQGDKWLKAQVKAEAVENLKLNTREIEYVRTKLIKAEQGGFSSLSAAEILAKSKQELRQNEEQ